MNALLFTDVQFDSDESWQSFSLVHGMNHQVVYDTLLRDNKVPAFYPLFEFPKEDNAEYLLEHYQVHLAQARLLELPGIPDLSTVDLSDVGERQDWLQLHATVHINENEALGL